MPCDLSALEIINLLGLVPHPEGGHYRETFRDPKEDANRAASSAIYFLLVAGETSRWHRVDAAEVWHWYAGSGLKLRLWEEGRQVRDFCLGADLSSGQRPQAVVPAGVWQAPTRSVIGPSSAARSLPHSSSKASSWHHLGGSRGAAG